MTMTIKDLSKRATEFKDYLVEMQLLVNHYKIELDVIKLASHIYEDVIVPKYGSAKYISDTGEYVKKVLYNWDCTGEYVAQRLEDIITGVRT